MSSVFKKSEIDKADFLRGNIIIREGKGERRVLILVKYYWYLHPCSERACGQDGQRVEGSMAQSLRGQALESRNPRLKSSLITICRTLG